MLNIIEEKLISTAREVSIRYSAGIANGSVNVDETCGIRDARLEATVDAMRHVYQDLGGAVGFDSNQDTNDPQNPYFGKISLNNRRKKDTSGD